MFMPKNEFFQAYEEKLKESLNQFLPGERAQSKMAPLHRHPKKITHHTKKAGVLLLLYPKDTEVYTVFIKRQVYEGVHSGQISLPGGKMEKTDNTIIDTALRETREEIGINPKHIKIIGKLTELFIPVSDYIVQPVIGTLHYEPEYSPDPREVDDIFSVPLKKLTDPVCVSTNQTFTENNKKYTAPFYKVDNLQIWGATAMILSEFMELYEKTIKQTLKK
ncbi:MAG: NUDIX hydrolase [Bacteroidales bacterium]